MEKVMLYGQRYFTSEFKLGDRVNVIRTRHGFFVNGVNGPIIKINSMSCIVRDEKTSVQYEVDHCRDIAKYYVQAEQGLPEAFDSSASEDLTA